MKLYIGSPIVQEDESEFQSLCEIEKHLKLLEYKFDIKCSLKIFSKEEIEILRKYGAWLEALYLSKINPLTEKQLYFLDCIQKGIQPENEIAKAYFKYLKRIEIKFIKKPG